MTLPGAAHLDLVCRRCTRAATFYGTAKESACAAISAGWRMTNAETNEFSCPKCNGHKKNEGFRKPTVVTFSNSFENGMRRDIESIIHGFRVTDEIVPCEQVSDEEAAYLRSREVKGTVQTLVLP